MKKITKIKTMIFLSVIGVLDSSFLTYKHFFNDKGISCPVTGAGCDIVTNSIYSEIFGVPLAVLGVLYYLSVFVALIWYLREEKDILLKLAFVLVLTGFLFSVYLFYLQAYVLYAFCIYCLVSAVVTTILFIISLFVIKNNKI